MAKLFEYAIIHNPKATKDAQGNDTTAPSAILTDPTHILAKDEKEVAMRAARQIPDTYLDKLDEVEVLVRPF